MFEWEIGSRKSVAKSRYLTIKPEPYKRRRDFYLRGDLYCLDMSAFETAYYCPYGYYLGFAKSRVIDNYKDYRVSAKTADLEYGLAKTLEPVIAKAIENRANKKYLTVEDFMYLWRKEKAQTKIHVVSEKDIDMYTLENSVKSILMKINTLDLFEGFNQENISGEIITEYSTYKNRRFGLKFIPGPLFYRKTPNWLQNQLLVTYIRRPLTHLNPETLKYYLPFLLYLDGVRRFFGNRQFQLQVLYIDSGTGEFFFSNRIGNAFSGNAKDYLKRSYEGIMHNVVDKKFYRIVGDHCEKCPVQFVCQTAKTEFEEL